MKLVDLKTAIVAEMAVSTPDFVKSNVPASAIAPVGSIESNELPVRWIEISKSRHVGESRGRKKAGDSGR